MATQQFKLPQSIILGGRESIEPAIINPQSTNHHLKLDAEFVAQARAVYRGHCKELGQEEGSERVKVKHYQDLAQSALSYYENRSCFLAGEIYIKHILDQQIILNRQSCKLTVST